MAATAVDAVAPLVEDDLNSATPASAASAAATGGLRNRRFVHGRTYSVPTFASDNNNAVADEDDEGEGNYEGEEGDVVADAENNNQNAKNGNETAVAGKNNLPEDAASAAVTPVSAENEERGGRSASRSKSPAKTSAVAHLAHPMMAKERIYHAQPALSLDAVQQQQQDQLSAALLRGGRAQEKGLGHRVADLEERLHLSERDALVAHASVSKLRKQLLLFKKQSETFHETLHNLAGDLENQIATVEDFVNDRFQQPEQKGGLAVYMEEKTGTGIIRNNQNWSPIEKRSFGEGKTFKLRNSLLSDLLLVRDFQTLYNIFVSILIIFMAALSLNAYLEVGRPIDISLLIYTFGHLDIVVVTWLFMYAMFSGPGYLFRYVNKYCPAPLSITLYLTFQTVIAVIAGWVCLSNKLPPASGFIIMCEEARLAMKLHAWYRGSYVYWRNFGGGVGSGGRNPAISPDNNSADPASHDRRSAWFTHSATLVVPTDKYANYVYFLWAPTLIYRSSYPRTPRVRINVFLHHLLESLSAIFYTYAVFDRMCAPTLRNQMKIQSLESFAQATFNSMLPGTLVFLLGFFGILHSWLNAFAELTRFGDREYYRKWNGVVGAWLYEYVYLDAIFVFESYLGGSSMPNSSSTTGSKSVSNRRISGDLLKEKPRNQGLLGENLGPKVARVLATLVVVEFSAVVHEWVIGCAIGYFFPVLLLMFGGPGVIFIWLTSVKQGSRWHNIFMWCMLFIGNGLLLVLYTREWYTRHGNPEIPNDWQSLFVPYSLLPLLEKLDIIQPTA